MLYTTARDAILQYTFYTCIYIYGLQYVNTYIMYNML